MGAHRAPGGGDARRRRCAVDEDGRTLTFAEYRDRGRAGRGRARRPRRRRGRRRLVAAADVARVDGARRRALAASARCRTRCCRSTASARSASSPARPGPSCSSCPSVWRGFDYEAMAREIAGGARRASRCSSATGRCPRATRRRCPRRRRPPAIRPTLPVRWLFYTSGTTADPKGAQHTDRTIDAVGDRAWASGSSVGRRRPQRAGVPVHPHRRHRLAVRAPA